jgi:hypothetical protein
MDPLSIRNFRGTMPRVTPTLLPPNYAQVAHNARLEDGSLSPIREPKPIHTFTADMRSIYLFGDTWLGWDAEVKAAPGPVDASRLYITGHGAPKVYTEDTGEIPLKLDPPSAALTATNTETPDEATKIAVMYTYTFVTELDEESPPAPLSTSIWWSTGDVVDLTDLPGVSPVGQRRINRVRIYRSQTSALGTTDLYYCAEVAISTTSYSHNPVTEPLGEIIPSTDYDAPPDELRGLVSMPNGMMAAFRNKTLYFCEPWRPHAWPVKYTLTTDSVIVGLASMGTTLAVLTEATPYVVQGAHPDSMVMDKVEVDLPCVSARGIVDLGYSAVYPSVDGLALISPGSATLISQPLWTREQWRAMSPETIVAGQIAGDYLFSHKQGDSRRGIAIAGINGEPSVLTNDLDAAAMFYDTSSGSAYYLSGSRSVREWDPPDMVYKPLTWRSAPFVRPHPVGFGAFMVQMIDTSFSQGDDVVILLDLADDATNYITFEVESEDQIFVLDVDLGEFEAKIIADGSVIATFTNFSKIERIPTGEYSKWEIEITSTLRLFALHLAQTPSDLVGAT